jgi:hypothetical protein
VRVSEAERETEAGADVPDAEQNLQVCKEKGGRVIGADEVGCELCK